MKLFNSKKCEADYDEILKLEQAVTNLKHELESAQTTLKQIEQHTQDSEFVIDWSGMHAFAFERIMSGSRPVSIIGYFINTTGVDKNNYAVVVDTKTVKEWTLHCSDEQHDKLAIEFKTYLNTKAMK